MEEKATELYNKIQKVKYTAVVVNTNMLSIAQELYEIKTRKLYHYWDSEARPNWRVFISDSQIPLSHNVASKWARIYKFYIKDKGYKVEELVEITPRKLIMLLELKDKFNDEWLTMGLELSQGDLEKEINVALGKQKEEMQCNHKILKKQFKCEGCKGIFKKNPHDELN